MVKFICGRAAVCGLAILLSGTVFGQTDSSKHIHFTDVMVKNNNDGKHKTYLVQATDADGKTYMMRKSDGRIVECEVNGKAVPQDQYAYYEDLLGDLGKPPIPPMPPAAPAAPGMPASPVAPVAPVGVDPVAPAPPAAPAIAPAIAAPPASPLPPAPPAPPEPPRANKYISKIIDELIDKGVIADDVKLSFSLDNEQMTVNGVKQPDAVFQAFRQKYIKHAGDHFRYEHSGSSTTSTIKIDDDNH